MLIKVNNRWQAFGIHIALSLLLFLVLAAVICFFWYPGFLFRYDGGLEGMKLIAGVDFFIGPFLTLAVFKLGKKSLKFDLACIGLLQVICLCGGMWTIWKTRPIAVVYAAGSFATTNAPGYEAEKQHPEKIEALKTGWPVWLAVSLPEGSESTVSAVWALMGSGLQYNVENYVPYGTKIGELGKAGLQSTAIKDADNSALQVFEGTHANVRFFPTTTSMYDGYLAVDIKTGKALHFFKRN